VIFPLDKFGRRLRDASLFTVIDRRSAPRSNSRSFAFCAEMRTDIKRRFEIGRCRHALRRYGIIVSRILFFSSRGMRRHASADLSFQAILALKECVRACTGLLKARQ